MVPENGSSVLANDLLRIHRAITHGLTVAVTQGSNFTNEGFSDQKLQDGFVLYLQSLTDVLAAHHLGEDEVAFPTLKPLLPDVPYDQLHAEHKTIETELEKVKKSLVDLNGPHPEKVLIETVSGFKRIFELWMPHIEEEQIFFNSTAISSIMTQDEDAQVSFALAKHSQEHLSQPFFTLPFVLFNLSPADRAQMVEKMPKMVIEELIPGAWKEKWTPMQPFFLE